MPKSPDELRREADEIQQTGDTPGGKDPSRVAGGKKAAATRKEKYGSASPFPQEKGQGEGES